MNADEDRFHGVWVPVLTPFRADLSIDGEAFLAHCHWLLDQGVDGLAVFGTTSEANSLSLVERMTLLESLIDSGVPASKLMPGVGCCALPDTLRLCRHALERGCDAVLMLPPFYYKAVNEEGLLAAFSWVLEQTRSSELKVFLYHIPPVSIVPISMPLIARLREAYPGKVAGLKDSGGDQEHTRSVLSRFPDLAVFTGSERFLLDTLRHGGAGCITASGNVNPAGIRLVYERWLGDAPDTDAAQRGIDSIRDVLEGAGMIPALKSLCARHYGDSEWRRVRPPLTALSQTEEDTLFQRLDELGFSVADNRISVSRPMEANDAIE